MDVRHRSPKPSRLSSADQPNHQKKSSSKTEYRSPKASDALPLPLYLTNAIFFVLFFSVAYYLLLRWRDKIRSSTPLHVVDLSELLAIVSLIASFIYLLGFFGIGFVQSFIARSSNDGWDVVEDDDHHRQRFIIDEDRLYPSSCSASRDSSALPSAEIPAPQVVDPPTVTPLSSQEDEELVKSVLSDKLKIHSLETDLGDCYRAAFIRREAVQRLTGRSLSGLPFDGFDYAYVKGKCCEMPVGFVQIPLGIAGPLLLDGREYYIPMATTEGCLVASTNRGCKAISKSGGAVSILLKDRMTRAPIVSFATAKRAAELKRVVEHPDNFGILARNFEKSSNFAKLKSIEGAMAGKNLYIRFTAETGDAMGMNMVSIGVQQVLSFLEDNGFPDMKVIGISGNYCSDKKAAGVNWVNGRGKSVVCEATITAAVMKGLNVTVPQLVELNMLKNLAGSAIAGAMGGFNAHAANIVSAMFIATGQDPAQNIESSHCITMMEAVNNGNDLHISVTMPCIEVGTTGGGTGLASQSACLNLLGVKGPSENVAGTNAKLLATIVAGAVLAGELSLMAAIASGDLVNSHLKFNRSKSSGDVSKISS